MSDNLSMKNFTATLFAIILFLFIHTHFVYGGPPLAQNYDVFIEAEDAIENYGFDVIGPPRALGYSGGKMASLWSLSEPGAKGYFVEYLINVKDNANYYIIVWAQGLDTLYSSPFHVLIGQTELHFTKSTAKISNVTSRYGEDIALHVMGPVRLQKGKHLLILKVDERREYSDKAFNLLLDAIALNREVHGESITQQHEVLLTIDCTSSLGEFSTLSDASQGGIRDVTDYRFWASLTPILQKIRTKNVRIDHIFDDNYYGIVGRDKLGRLSYHWDELDAVLRQIIASGSRPYFCLSYMPIAISKGLDPYLPPRDYRDWKAVCTELVKHVKKRFELEGLYYEVWNEPDSEEFWKGSQQDYFELYKASVEAITTIDKHAKVGGPATSLSHMPWMNDFLKYIKRYDLPLDFVSWHIYHSSPQIYSQQIRYVKDILIGLGFPRRVETIISEWNIKENMHADNDAFYNAGHTAAILKVFQEEGLSKSFFFSLKDSSQPNVLHGEWGMVTSDNMAKPVYNLFQVYARLKGHILRVSTTDNSVNALATLDRGVLKMLIWNYNDGIKYGMPRQIRLKTNLEGTGLSHKEVKIETVRIDSKSSNLDGSESSIEAVNDYFEAKFELENGAIEYLELTPRVQ